MTNNVLPYLNTNLNLSNFHHCPCILQIIIFKKKSLNKKNMLHTFICNVTEVYNVKETINTACYLFFLRRKNKTMIKTLLLCISYLCVNSKIINRAKIHRLLENNSCSFLSEI